MTDGGKPRKPGAKRRKLRAAAAKPGPAETARPEPAAAHEAVAEEPSAPVGFSARDTAAEKAAASEPAAKGGGLRVAFVATALIAVVAVAGYLTRAAWIPGGKSAAATAKPVDKTKPAEPATAAAKPIAPAPAPVTSSGEPGQVDALIKEREQLRADLDRLIARLDGVEKSMDTAKQMIRATAPPADKVTGQPSLQKLDERVDALEKNDAALLDLKKRVERMEKDAGGGGEGRAIVLAVAGLADAVARGEQFERHLETLKAVAGGDPNIKAAVSLLSKHAATGIPTLTTLRDSFDKLAGKIVSAAKAKEDAGWMARAADRMRSVITLRRVGEAAEGGSADAVVARAESRLKAGDLAGTVRALDGLAANKKAAAVVEAWLAYAKARLNAERAVASLHVHAVSLLAPAK